MLVLGFRMGLTPENIRSTTIYDYNLMARAYRENMLHELNVMRINSYLVSVYSGLDSKFRKKLTPNKMFPLDNDIAKKPRLSREQVQEIFKRSNKRRGIC